MVIARKQTLVQLSDEILAELDLEVGRRGISRSALIREAVAAHLKGTSEAELVRQYIDGYRRFPETEGEMREAEQRGIEMIREEPW